MALGKAAAAAKEQAVSDLAKETLTHLNISLRSSLVTKDGSQEAENASFKISSEVRTSQGRFPACFLWGWNSPSAGPGGETVWEGAEISV